MDDRRIAGAVKEEKAFRDVERDGEPAFPDHHLRAAAVEQRVLEAAVRHQLIDEQEPVPAPVAAVADERHHSIAAVDLWRQRELVVELSVSLEGASVHELDGEGMAVRWDGGAVDGAEAALAELVGGGEGGGGAAESGVREAAGLVEVGGGRPATGELSEQKDEEEDYDSENGRSGRDGENEGRQRVAAVVEERLGRFWLARWHGGKKIQGN